MEQAPGTPAGSPRERGFPCAYQPVQGLSERSGPDDMAAQHHSSEAPADSKQGPAAEPSVSTSDRPSLYVSSLALFRCLAMRS